MVGLAILGGALQGVGGGMVEQAEARRQERLEAIRRMDRLAERSQDREFMLQRDEAGREFTREQTEVGHGFQRDMRAEDRAFTRAQTAEGQEFQREMQTTGHENQRGLLTHRAELERQAAAGQPPTGMTANEARLYDEIRSQYFARDGMPLEEAGGLSAFIQHLRTIPAERGGGRFNQIADQLTAEIGGDTTPQERATERADAEAAILDQARRDRQREFGRFAAFTSSPDERQRFEENRVRELRSGGSQPAQPAQTGQSGERYPPAPRDPEQRVIGQRYLTPDGRLVEWAGQGWRLVEG